jgi:uncharacterized protein YkwD
MRQEWFGMSASRCSRVLALACLVLTGAASAQRPDSDADELVRAINGWRSSGGECEGRRVGPAPPLSVNPALASAAVAASQRPIEALRQRGYLAAHIDTVFVSGPSRVADALRFLIQRYCKSLSSTEVSEIGIEHSGRTWHVVLGRPLIAPDIGDWRQAGLEVLRYTNAARSMARDCGDRRFPPAPPVAWNERLAASALAHAEDMARRDTLTHAGSGKTHSGDRATRAGYAWDVIGENIASGQGSARIAVDSWLRSPEHCATLMDGRFTEMGAAYVLKPSSSGPIWWAQEFGRPR